MIIEKNKTLDGEYLKVSPFRSHIRKTNAHKHKSYYELVFLTDGSGIHSIDGVDFEIVPPMIFGIRQDQIHFWDIKSEPKGYVLIIKKEYIHSTPDSRIKKLISVLSLYNCFKIKDDSLLFLFDLLCQETQKRNIQNIDCIDGLLKTILSKILVYKPNSNFVENVSNPVYNAFKELLMNERPLFNKVKDYANKLNTTPQNLNHICRNEVDKSGAEVVSEYLISESKRLLIYSDSPINEICYSMGFKDNSHFSKYFKKFTGLTPTEFRNKNNI